MNARNSASAPANQARHTGSAAESSQWWKVWVLLTGLAATVCGWMAFPGAEQSPVKSTIAPNVSVSLDDEPISRVDSFVRRGQVDARPTMLPAMPQKPVFQQPVTRTRRS